MSKIYKTKDGDTWDIIAKDEYGDERYTSELMEANPDLLDKISFEYGIDIYIPDIEIKDSSSLPPWKQE